MRSLLKQGGRYYLQFYDSGQTPMRKKVPLGTTSRRVAERLRRQLEAEYFLGRFDAWTRRDIVETTLGEAYRSFLSDKLTFESLLATITVGCWDSSSSLRAPIFLSSKSVVANSNAGWIRMAVTNKRSTPTGAPPPPASEINWIVLRKRKKTKDRARETYHPRYYARLSQALQALLNEIPKESNAREDIAALAKAVKDAEARVAELRPEDGPRRKVEATRPD